MIYYRAPQTEDFHGQGRRAFIYQERPWLLCMVGHGDDGTWLCSSWATDTFEAAVALAERFIADGTRPRIHLTFADGKTIPLDSITNDWVWGE